MDVDNANMEGERLRLLVPPGLSTHPSMEHDLLTIPILPLSQESFNSSGSLESYDSGYGSSACSQANLLDTQRSEWLLREAFCDFQMAHVRSVVGSLELGNLELSRLDDENAKADTQIHLNARPCQDLEHGPVLGNSQGIRSQTPTQIGNGGMVESSLTSQFSSPSLTSTCQPAVPKCHLRTTTRTHPTISMTSKTQPDNLDNAQV